jgi:hypothetical protein
MSFTFYADLLGMSSTYKLSADAAHQKLNDFYNTTFSTLDPEWERTSAVRTIMFSDSLLITGRNPLVALNQLHALYLALSHRGLLLRGAIVGNEFQFEPRVTRENFQKFLPLDDTLARAVGLESTQKGARLVIENALARRLLEVEPDWLTQDGYVRNPQGRTALPRNSALRRIAPTPDGGTYEYLYFWSSDHHANIDPVHYQQKRDELTEVKKMIREDIGEHYKETIGLLSRCESRDTFTAKYLNI